MHCTRSLFTLGLLATTALAQLQLTVPASYASTIGNSNNVYPWARTTGSMRFQQVYDSSHFTGQSITYPILISGMKFRPYSGATSTWTGGTWSALRVDMATCTADYLALSATFSNNLGPNLTTVHNGPLTIAGGTTLGAGVVVPSHVDVPFSTSFVYDPSAGDLIFDVYVDGPTWGGGSVRGCDVVSGATSTALASRVYATSGMTAVTGTIGTNHALICEFQYAPAAGLHPSFTSDVTGGPSPLTVQFTDRTYTDDPAGILAWVWDFDGDNVVDSTLQHPSFTYANCGTYDVSLTAIDATHGSQTITRTGYIKTDALQADFTYQVVGPYTVLFTDHSSPAATSWAWDLDGDSVVDSTGQSAAWVYPNANPVNVTLTATRLCSAPSTKTKAIVPVQSVSHNVAPNNGLGSGASVYFDLNVLNPAGLSITSLDVAPNVANLGFTVELYSKPLTYLGFTGAASEWVLNSTGTSAGGPSISTASASVLFPQPIYLRPGVHGIKLRYIGVGPRYQTGIATVTTGTVDATLTLGTSRGSTVADPWAGTDIAMRLWSGVLYYGTQNLTGLAGLGAYGPGCAGTLGVPHATGSLPQLGSSLTIDVNNLAQSLAIMLTGMADPLTDLAPFGAPGCWVRVSPDISGLLLGAGNAAQWQLPIPNHPSLMGVGFFHQALSLDPSANALGAVMSDALASQLGN